MNWERARLGFRRGIGIAAGTAVLVSCGGGSEGGETASADSQQSETAGGDIARADFVLCPAIEEIADTLAAVVGFERDTERAVAGIAGQCVVRGPNGAQISIEMAPAITPSIAMLAEGYEGASEPAADLGEDAVFIESSMQPHVIFSLRGQIIDVGMETMQGAPERATVIEVGKRVRDALAAANGG